MCYARGASASPLELCHNTHSTPSLVCHETVRSVCSAHHICSHNISYRQFLQPIAAPLNADVHLSRLSHCDDPKIKAYCVRTLKNMTTSDSADVSRVREPARQGYFCYFTSCSPMAHFCFICSVPDVGILLPILFSPQALEEGAVANLIAMSLEVDLAPFSPFPFHFYSISVLQTLNLHIFTSTSLTRTCRAKRRLCFRRSSPSQTSFPL